MQFLPKNTRNTALLSTNNIFWLDNIWYCGKNSNFRHCHILRNYVNLRTPRKLACVQKLTFSMSAQTTEKNLMILDWFLSLQIYGIILLIYICHTKKFLRKKNRANHQILKASAHKFLSSIHWERKICTKFFWTQK